MRFVTALIVCCGCFLFGRKKPEKPRKQPQPPSIKVPGSGQIKLALEVGGEGVRFAKKPLRDYLVKILEERGIVAVVDRSADYTLEGRLKVRVVSRREHFLQDEWEFEISGEWRLYREIPGRRDVKAIRRLLLRRRATGRSEALHLLFSDAAREIAAAIRVAP